MQCISLVFLASLVLAQNQMMYQQRPMQPMQYVVYQPPQQVQMQQYQQIPQQYQQIQQYRHNCIRHGYQGQFGQPRTVQYAMQPNAPVQPQPTHPGYVAQSGSNADGYVLPPQPRGPQPFVGHRFTQIPAGYTTTVATYSPVPVTSTASPTWESFSKSANISSFNTSTSHLVDALTGSTVDQAIESRRP